MSGYFTYILRFISIFKSYSRIKSYLQLTKTYILLFILVFVSRDKIGKMVNPNRKSLCAKKTFSLISMLGLTSSFFLVEIIVGYITGSVALIADSFHMLSDVISLIVGLFALRYSKKSGQTDRNTFGWQRAEVLGALINAVFLVALCFTILIEALKRLIEVEEIINPWLVLIVGGAGLFINIIGLFMFHGHGHSHGGGHHGHSHGVVSNGHSTLAVDSGQTVLPNIGNVEENDLSDLDDTSQTSMFKHSYLKDAKEIQKFATGENHMATSLRIKVHESLFLLLCGQVTHSAFIMYSKHKVE